MSVKQHRDNTIIPYIIEVLVLRLKEKEALTWKKEGLLFRMICIIDYAKK